MKSLYAPWRGDYVSSHKSEKSIEGCVFCHIVDNPDKDDELHVLYRDEYCFMVMNKYPYTPGHFMVIPNFHTDKLEELDPKVWIRMNLLAQKGVALLKDVMNAKGVNLGMNLGASAGAGIAEHIHLHLVPRWDRDTNFITTIGEARTYGTDFDKTFKDLKEKATEYFTL